MRNEAEMTILPVFYPHRRNPDGSFYSLCLDCLATVAVANSEAELAEYDSKHVCEVSASLVA
jgi:hypothetical protein